MHTVQIKNALSDQGLQFLLTIFELKKFIHKNPKIKNGVVQLIIIRNSELPLVYNFYILTKIVFVCVVLDASRSSRQFFRNGGAFSCPEEVKGSYSKYFFSRML